MRKPLLLVNRVPAAGPLVSFQGPCEVFGEGITGEDQVEVRRLGSALEPVGSVELRNGDRKELPDGVWLQAFRLLGKDREVSVFASTK